MAASSRPHGTLSITHAKLIRIPCNLVPFSAHGFETAPWIWSVKRRGEHCPKYPLWHTHNHTPAEQVQSNIAKALGVPAMEPLGSCSVSFHSHSASGLHQP